MKSIFQLSSAVTGLVNSHFIHFKSDSKAIHKAYNDMMKAETFTASGKRRLPHYTTSAAFQVFNQMKELYMKQHCIYCYKIDGVLYATYNKKSKDKYHFQGETKIKNYRKNKKIDHAVLHGEYTESGFYYGCGKPYFITTK